MGGRATEGREDAKLPVEPDSTAGVVGASPPSDDFASLRLCVLTYSHSPSFPPSRPYPDSRSPPNPLAASNRLVQLTQTVPALSCGATSSAVLRFSLHTLA